MCVLLYGAVSSPGVANFALKKCALNCRERFGDEAFFTVMRNFYVDDLLKSEDNDNEAAEIATRVNKICASTGFNLTKFVSPSLEVISRLPPKKRAKFIDDVNIPGPETIERALGVTWCVERDTLRFRIAMQDNPLTRRGMLKSISTVYDPDGNASAFLLEGRKIFQETTSEEGGWDKRVSEMFASRWSQLREEFWGVWRFQGVSSLLISDQW